MASLVASVLALRPKAQRGSSVGRPTRLTVHSNVKLVHVKQNTQQKIASMQYQSGYMAYQPDDIGFPKQSIVVGACSTAGSPVDVLIPIPTVSATHAKLMGTAEGVLVQDLGSTNGTFIDGKKVEGSCVASPGQVISFDDNLGIAFTVTLDMAAPTLTPKQVGNLNASMAMGYTSEALLEERIKDRSAWIAAYNGKSGGGGGGMTSEAALGDRIQDRSAWIDNYNSKSGGASGGMTSEAALGDRIQDRSAWIDNYNSKSGGASGGMTSEAALGDRIQDRSQWIASYRA